MSDEQIIEFLDYYFWYVSKSNEDKQLQTIIDKYNSYGRYSNIIDNNILQRIMLDKRYE